MVPQPESVIARPQDRRHATPAIDEPRAVLGMLPGIHIADRL